MEKKEIETFYATSRRQWRQWLQKNHAKKQSVWLIMYKKDAGIPTVNWADAVEEALCFGWIDSIRRSLDDEKFIQYYSKRKPKSVWSKINKDKVKQLIGQGLMAEAGLKSIQLAKQNGSWTALDNVEALEIPADLAAKFKSRPGSKARFLSLSKSVRKVMLLGLMHAKRPETRMKRIDEIIAATSSSI
jgi:uncharacterized protein YdeI (YjbR/CyaY-like superfamily)